MEDDLNPETTLALTLVILECRASSTVGSDPRAGRREGKKVKGEKINVAA